MPRWCTKNAQRTSLGARGLFVSAALHLRKRIENPFEAERSKLVLSFLPCLTLSLLEVRSMKIPPQKGRHPVPQLRAMPERKIGVWCKWRNKTQQYLRAMVLWIGLITVSRPYYPWRHLSLYTMRRSNARYAERTYTTPSASHGKNESPQGVVWTTWVVLHLHSGITFPRWSEVPQVEVPTRFLVEIGVHAAHSRRLSNLHHVASYGNNYWFDIWRCRSVPK